MARLTALLLLLAPAVAHGHDWYPPNCCSGGDCGPIKSERVTHADDGDGYVVDGKFHVKLSEVRRSPDGRYHGCFPTQKLLRCFWAPPDGS